MGLTFSHRDWKDLAPEEADILQQEPRELTFSLGIIGSLVLSVALTGALAVILR